MEYYFRFNRLGRYNKRITEEKEDKSEINTKKAREGRQRT